MNDDVLRDLQYLRDLRAQGRSDEEITRALLDLTLEAAPPELAGAVRACALPAWFDAALLALLAEMSEEEAAELVAQIGRFSFALPREGGGYVYHEATRERLLDWWRQPDHRTKYAGLVERLAGHYVALAEDQDRRLSGPEYRAALADLDHAWPNIQAARQGALEIGSWGRVRDFAYTLADYFRYRGLWAEWIAWCQAGLEACEHLEDEAGAAAMQNNLGNAYADLPVGDRAENLSRAIACYEEALRFRTPEAAPLAYATTQNNLGVAYLNKQDYERAFEAFGQALAVLPQDARTHYNTACAHALQGDTEEACVWLERAIDLDEKYRAMARDDEDFDGIRDDERFQALVGASSS